MPRPRVEKVRLSGFISENTSDLDLVKFFQKEKKDRKEAELVRDMAVIYKKYRDGKLIDASLLNTLGAAQLNMIEKPEEKDNTASLDDLQDLIDEFDLDE